MSDKNSGPEKLIKGVVEGVKGKVKEVAGAVAGRDDLYREGQAQQDKAEAQRNAAQKEAEAEGARAAAQDRRGASEGRAAVILKAERSRILWNRDLFVCLDQTSALSIALASSSGQSTVSM